MLYNSMVWYGVISESDYSPTQIALTITNTLLTLNFSVNFLLYCYALRDFRNTLTAMVKRHSPSSTLANCQQNGQFRSRFRPGWSWSELDDLSSLASYLDRSESEVIGSLLWFSRQYVVIIRFNIITYKEMFQFSIINRLHLEFNSEI